MNSPKRIFSAEMDVHLANEARAGISHGCNGTSSKTVLTTRSVVVHLRIPESKNGISAFFWAIRRELCFPRAD
jgi:hypothetical protein